MTRRKYRGTEMITSSRLTAGKVGGLRADTARPVQ